MNNDFLDYLKRVLTNTIDASEKDLAAREVNKYGNPKLDDAMGNWLQGRISGEKFILQILNDWKAAEDSVKTS